jgi:hypothetical protein
MLEPLSGIISFLGFIFTITGAVMMMVYNIQLMVLAFRASFLWGLCYIFLPGGNVHFALKHRQYEDTREAALRFLAGAGVCIGGILAFGFFRNRGVY